jgi:hypothetical protein
MVYNKEPLIKFTNWLTCNEIEGNLTEYINNNDSCCEICNNYEGLLINCNTNECTCKFHA